MNKITVSILLFAPLISSQVNSMDQKSPQSAPAVRLSPHAPVIRSSNSSQAPRTPSARPNPHARVPKNSTNSQVTPTPGVRPSLHACVVSSSPSTQASFTPSGRPSPHALSPRGSTNQANPTPAVRPSPQVPATSSSSSSQDARIPNTEGRLQKSAQTIEQEATDLQHAIALSFAKPQAGIAKARVTTTLPDELFAAYVTIIEDAASTEIGLSTKQAIKKIVDTYYKEGSAQQKERVTTLLYEDLQIYYSEDFPLQRCFCDDAPLKKRIELLLDMKQRMQGQDKQTPIVYTSFGSGLLIQDFWAIRELQTDGFKNITVNVIEATAHPKYKKHTALLAALKEFARQTGLHINLFDQSKKALPGCINVFSNTYHYCGACLENPALKSTIMTMIDPHELSYADNPEEVSLVEVYLTGAPLEEISEEENQVHPPADIIISCTNRAHPRIHVQPISLEIEHNMAFIEAASEIIRRISDPITIKTQLQAKFPNVYLAYQSSPVILYRDMIELALIDNGFAYIIADDMDLITRGAVKVIARSEYNQQAYNADAQASEAKYLRKEHYIAL